MAAERRPNFDFIEMGIPIGSELVAVSDPNVKVTVKDNRKVLYNGKEYYLSGLEDELHLIGKPCGHWYFEGKGLDDIYNETYEKNESQDSDDILQTIKDEITKKYEKYFYIYNPEEKHDTYIWIGDKQHLIGEWPYHYEINIGKSKNSAYGHDGNHIFVELHIGEQKTVTIANFFGETVKALESKPEIDGFEWRKEIHSLRLSKGKSGHELNEKNLVKVLIKELIELDSIVGSAMREKISEYERPERIKKLIDKYKKLLKITNNTKFIDEELFKWKYITECKGQSTLQIINYLIKSNSILLDTSRVIPGWKELLKDNPAGFELTVANLMNETKTLDERIVSFENEMKNLFKPYPKFTVYANDERTASCFLGCRYPDKYTFFKPERLYYPLCDELGVEIKDKRSRYKHFLELLNDMLPYIKNDSELQTIINEKTKDYIKSDLLTAQNICHCVFQEKAKELLGENIMSTKSKELIEYTDLLKNKLNVILQGAPGTGKTYTTASLALSICGVEDIDYSNRDAVMEKYKQLREDGRIGFCTFHQSMDYEDFIEGLRPFSTENGIVYKPEAGLFKIMCERASKNQGKDIIKAIDDYIASIEGYENRKEIPTKSGRSSLLVWHNKGNNTISTRSTLSESSKDPEYTPSPLNIEKIKMQALGEGVENNWEHYAEAFINAVKKEYNLETTSSSDEPYVLIIDEINRGYVSKIFGELITLLETDKRLGNPQTELTVELPYSKETFGVPKNLYIIGTMNTTDRSTGTLDYAVRRRFAFVTLAANESILEKTDACEEAKALFREVKTFIEKNKLEDIDIGDLMVGHSYFMTNDTNILKQKIKYEVIPLVKEYIKDGILTCLTSEAKEYFDDWLELNVHNPQETDE